MDLCSIVATCGLVCGLSMCASEPGRGPRFVVRLDPGVASGPVTGRLIVAIDDGGAGGREPRRRIGEVVGGPKLLLARDVDDWAPGESIAIDGGADSYPAEGVSRFEAGEYRVQVVLRTNPDLRVLNAPGDLHSKVAAGVRVDPGEGVEAVALVLDRREPLEEMPEDTERVKYLRLPSAKLSAFHGRPMFVRVAVALPKGHGEEPGRTYPVWVQVGGYGSRFTEAGGRFRPGGSFAKFWEADDTPRFLHVQLDGSGPLGDPYQVNSANHGPYGDVVVEEVLPEIEQRFRGNGRRVVSGGSTGGWVSLALQLTYPEAFAGCWSACADSVDFRRFQLVNIYDDDNAYVDDRGVERAAARDPRTGRVRYTMRQEAGLENVIGRGGSWAESGGQWGAWNATYGPRGQDGRPLALWDPKTGVIDKSVVDHWREYDLRLQLEKNWVRLEPLVRGKVRIWMGDADDFFLNEAMRLFDKAVRGLEPPADFQITYGPGRGHCWRDIDDAEMVRQMAEVVDARP